MKRVLLLLLGLLASPAAAQWQVASGSIPVGRGPGVIGFTTVTGSAGTGTKCLIDTTPPTFGACGGGGTPGGSNTQVQYNNTGAFGGITGATTNGTILTLVAPVLGTPTSVTLTNATGLPISSGVSGLGAGVATALGTMSSANLRAAVTDESGTGVLYFQNGALGTPSSGTLTSATGLPISTGLTGTGTGVLTALAANIGSAGAFVTFNGALGTPSSGTLTNATGLPVGSGISGFGAGVATWLATPSSANLAAAVTDETGTGALVFAGGPTFSADITVTGNVNTSGTISIFGPGTTGTNNSSIRINGGSGSNAGASAIFQRNGVNLFSFGNSSGILGGASDDFVIYSNVSGAGTNAAIAVSSATSNVTINNGIATPAGGSTSARLLFGTTAGFGIYYGSGAPTVSAAKGSLYLRSDGSTTNDRMYINTNGSTTWTAVTTAA